MPHKLTQKDIDDMTKEMEYRKITLRKQLLDEVKETRAQGDLSENFEYHAAKQAKNKNESRIRYLERMIKQSTVIEDTTTDDEAGLGKKVTIYVPDDDEEETYTIVTTVRHDIRHGLISNESPLGKSLIGHKAGDTVHIQVNERIGYDAVVRKVEKADEEAKLRDF